MSVMVVMSIKDRVPVYIPGRVSFGQSSWAVKMGIVYTFAREGASQEHESKSQTTWRLLILFNMGMLNFRSYCSDFGWAEMAGSGRFPGWRIPTPMPGW